MKRKTMIFIMLITFILGATVSVAAIYRDDPYAQKKIRLGYTEEDMLNLDAILYLSEENVRGLILQKYDELKDWKKVCEYYKVDEKAYENYMIGKKMHQEVLDSIPDYIFDEMKARGWTKFEISDFADWTNISKIDCEYAWQECKKGRTIMDIVKEKRLVDQEKSNLDTEFVTGEMSLKEYENKVSKILNQAIVKKTSRDVNAATLEVEKLRTNVRDRHKKACGITGEEIKYCELQGITNPMDMYQAKRISSGNKISLEKVVASKLKNKDWAKATAEVLNISYDEYKRINETEEIK